MLNLFHVVVDLLTNAMYSNIYNIYSNKYKRSHNQGYNYEYISKDVCVRVIVMTNIRMFVRDNQPTRAYNSRYSDKYKHNHITAVSAVFKPFETYADIYCVEHCF